MRDTLAHLRPLFAQCRVVAGPERFYAMAPGNCFQGPVRQSMAEAEADADALFAALPRLAPGCLAAGGLAFSNRGVVP